MDTNRALNVSIELIARGYLIMHGNRRIYCLIMNVRAQSGYTKVGALEVTKNFVVTSRQFSRYERTLGDNVIMFYIGPRIYLHRFRREKKTRRRIAPPRANCKRDLDIRQLISQAALFVTTLSEGGSEEEGIYFGKRSLGPRGIGIIKTRTALSPRSYPRGGYVARPLFRSVSFRGLGSTVPYRIPAAVGRSSVVVVVVDAWRSYVEVDGLAPSGRRKRTVTRQRIALAAVAMR